jgi:hypothetical protein
MHSILTLLAFHVVCTDILGKANKPPGFDFLAAVTMKITIFWKVPKW